MFKLRINFQNEPSENSLEVLWSYFYENITKERKLKGDNMKSIIYEAIGFFAPFLNHENTQIAYSSCIYTGDLFRYLKEWEIASMFYNQSIFLCPSIGKGYSQLAILNPKKEERSLLLFYKSMLVDFPVDSKNNLMIVTKQHAVKEKGNFLALHAQLLLADNSPLIPCFWGPFCFDQIFILISSQLL